MKNSKVKKILKRGAITITITISLALPWLIPQQITDIPVEVEVTTEEQLDYDYTTAYDVIRVVDGDTFKIEFEGKEQSVRLIGIDTPETVHPRKPVEYYGTEASNFTKETLNGQKVYLGFDVEKYDYYKRPLVYVYLENGDMFNSILVEQGYAYAKAYPPNTKYQKLFDELQDKAKEKGLGIWNVEARTLYEQKE